MFYKLYIFYNSFSSIHLGRNMKSSSRLVAAGLVFIFLVVSLLMTSFDAEAISVTSCTTIDSPGSYYLTADLLSNTETCINITSSDVIFDGQGHTIGGPGMTLTGGPTTVPKHGVFVHSPATILNNVEVRNLQLLDWDDCILYEEADNGIIVKYK
jgi:hypothetical protein